MISIIIPTYNEKDNVNPLIETINKICASNNIKYEIVIIDDASTDNTGAYISKKYDKDPRVRCFIRTHERDLGTAILYGITKAKGDIIIGMDADFNHPPEAVPILIKALREKKGEMIVGSRFIRGGGMHGVIRSFGSRLVNIILRTFFRFPIHDNLSGMYAIHTPLLKQMNIKNIYAGYGEYHMRLVWHAHHIHELRIHEIPVQFGKRRAGSSKSNLLSMLINYFITAWRLSQSQTYHGR